jgi:hypothetical protein
MPGRHASPDVVSTWPQRLPTPSRVVAFLFSTLLKAERNVRFNSLALAHSISASLGQLFRRCTAAISAFNSSGEVWTN